jgi:hypothetical protein
LNRGYAVDFGRWCGSNGSVDGRDFANFANGVWAKTWRRKPLGVPTARGASPTRPPWPLLCQMPTLPNSGFHPWSCGLSLIRRTAVCGPACTVVWQGRRGDPSPYADWCARQGLKRKYSTLREVVELVRVPFRQPLPKNPIHRPSSPAASSKLFYSICRRHCLATLP